VKIVPVTPGVAASSPTHPDHARWVKERTLAREIAQAASEGLGIRVAEERNARALERLSNRRPKPKKAKPTRRDPVTHEQLKAAGVTKRAPKPRKLPPMPPCRLCRTCIWCKRTFRMSQIRRRAVELDQAALGLMQELVAIMLAAQQCKDYRDALGRELPFSRIQGVDVDKAVTQGIEWVCDRSTTFMGQWR
jgi:hypothetical protein